MFALVQRCLTPTSPFARPAYSRLGVTRSYRPEILRRAKERTLQQRKPIYRVIDEMYGLEPVVPSPQRERVPDTHPQFTNRVSFGADNPHYHEQRAFIFSHDVSLEEGVKQALWLTKSKLVGDGKMPSQVQKLADSFEIPDMENKVRQSILQCRQYDTTSTMLARSRYCFTLTAALLRLCSLLGTQHPQQLLGRAQATNYYVAASWTRENDIIQVRGRPGMIITTKTPLPLLVSEDDVDQTRDWVFESFYPLSPIIDLRPVNVYKDNYNMTGFFEGYPFPHAHTLFVTAPYYKPGDASIAKGIMFAFANALSRAKLLYGAEATDLPTPIVTQCIITNGVRFSFVHVQLNTLDLGPNTGPKNMVWLEPSLPLYEDMYPQDVRIVRIKGNRKTDRRYWRPLVNRDPGSGCRELDVGVFRKFLGCYMYGAIHG